MGTSWQNVLGPGASSWIASSRNEGREYAPLEAVHDQVGPVELRGVEGASAVDWSTRSLGGIEAPETLVVA